MKKLNREKTIIATSFVGIAGNLLLVAAKATIGIIAHSVSVILDAVNNLTDMLSSIITIIGTKIAHKKPDKKHPFGHGRVEYVTALAIAVIILVAGGSAIYTSITSLIEGSQSSYTYTSLIIISVAILVKVFLGLLFRKVGKKVESEALKASGIDALFDAILSTATLIGALIGMFAHVYIEGYLGILIGLFIIKSGIDVLRTALSSIIGERPSKELALKIKKIVNSFDGVLGAYDLILNNYGPNRSIGSIHIEVNEDMTAREIHKLTRQIQEKIYLEIGVILTVGIYANNISNKEIIGARNYIYALVRKYENIQEIHGFYMDINEKFINFDIIVDFKSEDSNKEKESLLKEIQAKYPDYNINIVLDIDLAD